MVDEYAPLHGIRRADAVIVGAGLTGLMTGAALSREGMRVIVLDAEDGMSGASALCSGSATLLAAHTYRRIIAHHELSAAQEHALTMRSLLQSLPERVGSLTTWREADAYAYAFLPRDLPELEAQKQLYASLGIPAVIAPDAGGCPFPVELSLMLKGQLLLDAQALRTSLARLIRQQGGRVCHHSRMIGLESGRVFTPEGRADAPVVILACGKPPGCIRRSLLALLETRTLIACRLTSSVPLHTLQQSVRPGGLCITPTRGGAHAFWCAGRSGTQDAAERTEMFTRVLSGRLKDWKTGTFRFRQDIWPEDGLPLAGVLTGYPGQVLCATGYSSHGLLGAVLTSDILTRYLLGKTRPSDQLYQPDRKIRLNMRRLTSIRLANAQRWRAPRCSLCACRMRYSIPAARWECPFCGSAFGMMGEVINGPTVQGADISPRQRPDL